MKDLNQTICNNEVFVFQQDSAPLNKSNVTRQWCNENLPGFIRHHGRPSSSPDLNPIDYFVWGYLQDTINFTMCQNLEELKHRLVIAWDNLDLEKVRAAINSWIKRLGVCESKRILF